MWPRLSILAGLLAGVAAAALVIGGILAFVPEPGAARTPPPRPSASLSVPPSLEPSPTATAGASPSASPTATASASPSASPTASAGASAALKAILPGVEVEP